MNFPLALQNPSFKFAIAGKNSKLPIEKSWNKDNCYPFFHAKFLRHMKDGYNYIVCTGHGNLIVIDFDCPEYYYSIAHEFPPTFTVASGGKRLPHLYYLLEDSDQMFKKIAILDKNKKVLADIQASKVGVIGPGSFSNNKMYTVTRDLPITKIKKDTLIDIFKIHEKIKLPGEYTGPSKENPEQVDAVVKELVQLGIERNGNTHFKCPFHESSNGKNLSVMPTGMLYCFHEQKSWSADLSFFKYELEKIRGRKDE